MIQLEPVFRDATPDDIAEVSDFILREGTNQWNFLPPEKVRQHVGNLATGGTRAVLAQDLTDELIGVVTYTIGHHYPKHQPQGRRDELHGYIDEVVVRRDRTGRGIGPKILRRAIEQMVDEHGLSEVYAMRHSDNEPSASMMERCGMKVVDEFDDPDIRPTGSHRTTVTQFLAAV